MREQVKIRVHILVVVIFIEKYMETKYKDSYLHRENYSSHIFDQ